MHIFMCMGTCVHKHVESQSWWGRVSHWTWSWPIPAGLVSQFTSNPQSCISGSQHISLALYGSWRIYCIPHPCMSSTLSTEPSPRGFSLLCYYMCICFYLHVCLCNMCTQWLWRPEENMWFPWNQSYRWLWAPIWVLRIGSSQATRALNHWASSHHTPSMIF